MRSLVTLLVIMALSLSGCSYLPKGSVRNRQATSDGVGAQNPLIPERENLLTFRKKDKPYTGTLVDQLTSIRLDPVSGGKMLIVEGLPLRQGAFEVRLVDEDDGDGPINGVLTYSLRAYQPTDEAQGTQNSRVVDAGVFIPRKDLNGVSSIRVVAARNQQSIRP